MIVEPGDRYEIEGAGVVLALAHYAARVVIDVPSNVATPRSMRILYASRPVGPRIGVGRTTSWLNEIVERAGSLFRRAYAAWNRGPAARYLARPTGGWLEYDTMSSSRRKRGVNTVVAATRDRSPPMNAML